MSAADHSSRPPQRKSLPPFEALRVFDAVARLGGIRRAAQFLQRDHAVVSRHLRALEVWLGMKLVERGANGIVLTDRGRSYHEHVARTLDQLAQATASLVSGGYHNRLHIWSTPGFALHWFSQHLGAFERAHPALDMELRPTDESPDFSAHEADVDLRFQALYEVEEPLASGVRSAIVASAPIIAVGSPDYLKKAGPIDTPGQLLSLALLHESSEATWQMWLEASGVANVETLGGPKLWQGHLTLDGARHGRGITLINSIVAREDLLSGMLVQVGKGNSAFPELLGNYVMTARKDRWDDVGIRVFRQWLTRTLTKEMPEFRPG